jgi:hypothetical protein
MTNNLTSAQIRYIRKSAHFPDRIIVGQIGCSHEVAEHLCKLGYWEKGDLDEWRGQLHQRYKLTDKGKLI